MPAKHPPIFIGSNVYRRRAFGENHPLAIPRVETVYDLCNLLEWLPGCQFVESPVACTDLLERFHNTDYVSALSKADELGSVPKPMRERFRFGTMENPYFSGVFERASTSVGGSYLAGQMAAEGRTIYHPSGGTHHGRPDRASGFCYFNDPVFAILALLDQQVEPIVYVDLDAHHGDGVQDAFLNDERVWTVSTHEAGRWPYSGLRNDTGGGRSLNLPVPADFNDAELAFLMERSILPFITRTNPGALVITVGADALAGDPLSRLALTNHGLCAAVMTLLDTTDSAVVLGGGGYNPWTLARCWTALWGLIAGYEIPDRLPADAQDLLEKLECDLVDEEDICRTWTTTLLDTPATAPVRAEIRDLVKPRTVLAG